MDHIKNLLSKRIRQTGLARQVSTALAIIEFQKIIQAEFGEITAKKIRALYIKNNILNVACLSSVVSQEFNFHKQAIIKELNEKIGVGVVKDIRLII